MQSPSDTIHIDKKFNQLIYTDKEVRGREFERCTFVNCDFSNNLFYNCTFTDCTFTTCNLTGAKLLDSKLDKATFVDCKLLGVDFSETNDFLFSVKFEGCILDFCSFSTKKLRNTPFMNCSITDADFTDADLTNALFQNTDLMNSVFSNTNLNRADLRTAENFAINPEHNSIKKAKFSLQTITGLLHQYDIIIE